MQNDRLEMLSPDIAVIGMSCRFPGADNVEIFWQNLINNLETISSFSKEDLIASGEKKEIMDNPYYVPVKGILNNVEWFDANFFGFNAKDAQLTDPQHRLFLECVWEALESAGQVPKQDDNLIGVYASMADSLYLQNNLLKNKEFLSNFDWFQARIATSLTMLSTQVSYRLNLTGPSLNITTACSSSLVTIATACRGLLDYDCDMAIAGASVVSVPQKRGYLYQSDSIHSSDGHCRVFEERSNGTVFSNGVSAIVLKRLQDAIQDGDSIHAVIKGWNINNDGASKIGFTAPSVTGQAKCISAALAFANTPPESISYIEAHGTGTAIGDPIEVKALTDAFGDTSKKQFCALGSVKANIGHMDIAAGMGSFIKTVLALENKILPATINYTFPNPKINFANTPFYVNAQKKKWEQGSLPRRAGVNASGIGGTNAFLILEEHETPISSSSTREYQLLIWSAKTKTALAKMTDNLIQHIENLSEMTPNHFADIAYTLQMGRAEFNYRRMVVGKDKKTILEELKKDSYHSSTTKKITNATNLKVVFMFSGQGSQYNDMARNLYTAEPEFAKWIDYCLDYLNSEIKPSVRSVLFGGEDQNHVLKDAIHNTRIVQSVLFIVEYALAKFLISLGIQPAAMIGHSIGEYVAATLAEVMDLEDVLNLIYRRGRLMSNTVSGAMLVVELSKDEITAWVQAEDVTIAAVNSLSQTVISGGIDKINKLEEKFKQQGIVAQRLKTSHAFHSHLMEPILAEFRIIISKIILKPPMIPFVSNVTGTWIQPEEATDPNYWTNHLRHTVLFEQGIKTLIEANYNIYLEVGVGKTLAHFVHAQVKKDANVCIQYTLPSSHEKTHDQAQFLFALGQLWLSGILPVWKSFYKDEQRQRIPLPTYPFDRQLYWVPPDLSEEIILPTKKSYSEWFYEPSWTRHSFKNNNITLSTFNNTYCWVLLLDRQGIGKYLNSILLANQQLIVKVAPAKRFKKLNDYEYQLDITNKEDYIALARNITNFTQLPLNIINLLSLTNEHDIGKLDLQEVEYTLYQSFYSILFLSQAFLSLSYNQKIKMTIIGNEIFSVNAEEPIYPAKATIIGTCRVIPAEHDIFNIQVIDLLLSEIKSTNQKDIICKQIILNVLSTNKENHANLLAYRKNFCWHQVFQPVDLRNDADFSLRQHGVYVFTGGLGGISLTLAKKIAQMTSCPRLILLSRSVFPLSEMGGKRLSCADC